MAKDIDCSFTRALMEWYRQNKRDLPWRRDKDPYHVWVSEIMLQQTRVEAVRDYYARFMKALPDVKALAEADEQTLLKLWQGLGYYNRVRNMHKAAVTVCQQYGGVFPGDYEGLRQLSGIGEYTAGAIASICFDAQVAAVDGNVLRVYSRLREDDGDIKSQAMKKRAGAYLQKLYPEKNCGDFTQGLIELGALVCIPAGAPRCDVCPVTDYCGARENHTAAAYPVKQEKKQRKKIQKTVFVLQCGGRLAVERRPDKGLLAGLYQFPNVDAAMDAAAAVRQAEDWGVQPRDLLRRVEYTHVFTHVEWEMTAYYFTAEREAEAFLWAGWDQLAEEIPLPAAFAYFLPQQPAVDET